MKFSIVKIPDEVPPKLYGPVRFRPGSPNVQKYVVVHEFEAKTGTEARAHFTEYETQWEKTPDVEPAKLTSMKFYICGKPGEVPNLLTDNPNPLTIPVAEPEHVVLHEFEVRSGIHASIYRKGYVARWEEAPDVKPAQLTYAVREGDIRVNAIWILHMTSESLLLAVDCAQKRPEYAVDYDADSGILEIGLRAKEDGDQTFVEVHGLSGDWHLFREGGKWGPRIALLKERSEHISLEETTR